MNRRFRRVFEGLSLALFLGVFFSFVSLCAQDSDGTPTPAVEFCKLNSNCIDTWRTFVTDQKSQDNISEDLKDEKTFIEFVNRFTRFLEQKFVLEYHSDRARFIKAVEQNVDTEFNLEDSVMGTLEARIVASLSGEKQIIYKHKPLQNGGIRLSFPERLWRRGEKPAKAMTTFLLNIPLTMNNRSIEMNSPHLGRYISRQIIEVKRDVTVLDLSGGNLVRAKYFELVPVLESPAPVLGPSFPRLNPDYVYHWKRATLQVPELGDVTFGVATAVGTFLLTMIINHSFKGEYGVPQALVNCANSLILATFSAFYENVTRSDENTFAEVAKKTVIKAVLLGYPLGLVVAYLPHKGTDIFSILNHETLNAINSGDVLKLIALSAPHLYIWILGLGDNFTSRNMNQWVRMREQTGRANSYTWDILYPIYLLTGNSKLLDRVIWKGPNIEREMGAYIRFIPRTVGYLFDGVTGGVPIGTVALWALNIPSTIWNDWRASAVPERKKYLRLMRETWLNKALRPVMFHRYKEYWNKYIATSECAATLASLKHVQK